MVASEKDYMFVISQDSKNFSALYNLANVEGSTSHWDKARDLFSKAVYIILDLPWLGQVWHWQISSWAILMNLKKN